MTNSLVAPGVRVTRETIEEAVENLALTCARGPVQYATIVELIETGTLVGVEYVVPAPSPWTKTKTTTKYGQHRLAYQSWMNMRKRLKAAGFVFTGSPRMQQMYWAPQSKELV